MRNLPQCNTDSSSHRILRRRTWHFHHNLVFHCNKEQHSTAVHVVFATDWRSNSVSESKWRETQGLFNKSCSCRGWVHRVGYHSSWLSVTWWSFNFPTSKPSLLLTSGLNEVSTKPALWKDLQMDSCYVYQTFTALCWSHRAVVLKVGATASWEP